MAEIDLIPADYRSLLEQKRTIHRAAIGLAVVFVLMLASSLFVSRGVQQAEAHAARLKAENAITQQQQMQLQQLGEQQAAYEQQLTLLHSLRAGAAIEDIFTLVDRALVDDRLWFLDWGFRRAGLVVDGEKRETDTGYFIIVSQESGQAAPAGLEVETRMNLRGQANDHQALSRFVRALFEQPDVRDVSVRRTTSTTFADRRIVEFDVGVILHSEFRSAR